MSQIKKNWRIEECSSCIMHTFGNKFALQVVDQGDSDAGDLL